MDGDIYFCFLKLYFFLQIPHGNQCSWRFHWCRHCQPSQQGFGRTYHHNCHKQHHHHHNHWRRHHGHHHRHRDDNRRSWFAWTNWRMRCHWSLWWRRRGRRRSRSDISNLWKQQISMKIYINFNSIFFILWWICAAGAEGVPDLIWKRDTLIYRL